MIPRVLHQVWIGPDPAPDGLIASWRDAHPGWEHRLWTEVELDGLRWVARETYDRYRAQKCWHGAVNVARVEILGAHGGVYIDADMRCLRPLDEAPFMDAKLWLSESPHKPGRPQNAAMGSTKGHQIWGAYAGRLSVLRRLRPAWRQSGAGMLEPLLRSHDHTMVTSPAFHPRRMDGTPNPAAANYVGPVYADHEFYSSNRRV